MTDDPDFYAWLDGELAEPEASAMAARVAADPELTALAAQHRALGARLSDAFAPVAQAPVPERLASAVRPQAEVIDFAAARERRRWTVTGLAMAASLALGLIVGDTMTRAGSGNYENHGAQLAASGPLAGALDRQLASAGEQKGIRIGLTFKDQSGRYCRSFNAEAQSGLACRGKDGWSVEGLVAGQQAGGDYRMAAGPDPALGAMIDRRIAGEAMDEAGEEQLVKQGWR